MGIAKLWDIIWHNEPFHWAIALVLIAAIIIELYTLWQYCFSECGTTEAAIKYLSNLNNVRLSNKVREWLREQLGTDEPSRFRRHDQKFVLTKYPSVLAHPIPRSSLRFVTTLCTAIGLLGTFYGIQQGLQGINLSTENTQELMTASKELLVGMKTAFSTSMMGLGSGSLFTLVLFGCDSLRQIRRNSLRQKLKKIATLQTTDNANAEVVQILSRVADQFTGLNQLSAEAIGQAVGQQMRAVILPGMQAIFREQQQIRELQANPGERVLEELIKNLRVQVIEPIAVRLDKSAELTQQASDAVLTLHNELGGISTNLANSIQTIQNFQKETLVELQGFANNLGVTLNQFQTDTKGVLQQTSLEINRAVDQSITGMIAQRSAFQASAEQAAATFQGIREELQTALQERAEIEKQMLQDTQTRIIQILTQANRTFHEQSNTLRTVGDQASGLMNDAKDNLLNTLGNIHGTLTATRQTVEEDLKRFREEYQENLQRFFQQQNDLLDGTLGEHRDGLARVVTNLERVFQEEALRRSQLSHEVDRSMNQIRQAATEVGNLATAVGLNSSQRLLQLQELARDISQQVLVVDNSYRELSTSFRDSLMTWQHYFDESQRHFFHEADSSMARVCGGLLETAKVLVAANNNDDNGNRRNHHG